MTILRITIPVDQPPWYRIMMAKPSNETAVSVDDTVQKAEDGGSMFLRNVGIYLQVLKALTTQKTDIDMMRTQNLTSQ
jgi:hypothetical protein